MKKILTIFFISLSILLGSSISIYSQENSRLVENFALFDHEGKFHELFYYSDKKAVVLIMQGNGCPIVRKNVSYLNELKDQYESRAVTFLMINANLQDDRFSIAKEAKEYDIKIPILEDRSQVIAEALDVSRTAEALVVNPVDWTIVYQGPINDRLGYEEQKAEVGHHYLRDAIDALLENRPVQNIEASVKGCLINLEYKGHNHQYTYTKDVAPILVKSCIRCHSPGEIAPWSMDNYKKVRGWGAMIREVVRTKRMPPWHADPYYGTFKNDFSLTPEDVRALVHWVEDGFLRGEGDDPLLSASRPKQGKWVLGEPDLIFSLKEEQQVPANGIIPYQIVEIEEPIEEDIWIRAIDLRPSNLKVVHHGDVTIRMPQQFDSEVESQNEWYSRSGLQVEGVGQVIAGYAPGFRAFQLPDDTGMFIPKGSKLTFWMHYITTGKPESDLTQLGLYTHKNKPKKVYSVAHIFDKDFKIPAGAREYKVNASHVFERDVILTAITPHMHYRGKSMKFTLQYPDGTKEVAFSIPHYKFHWQRRYTLKEPKKLPAGTRVLLEGVYDNSKQNPDNPDPEKEIQFGIQSENEMFSGFLSYTVDED